MAVGTVLRTQHCGHRSCLPEHQAPSQPQPHTWCLPTLPCWTVSRQHIPNWISALMIPLCFFNIIHSNVFHRYDHAQEFPSDTEERHWPGCNTQVCYHQPPALFRIKDWRTMWKLHYNCSYAIHYGPCGWHVTSMWVIVGCEGRLHLIYVVKSYWGT